MRLFDRSLASTRSQSHAPGFAILCMIAGGALIVFNNASTKSVSTDVPLGELIALRSFFALLFILLLLGRGPRRFADLRVVRPWAHLTRGLMMVISMFAFVASIRLMPMVDAQALVFVGPLMTAALAPLFLREAPDWHRWAAVIVGFAGVVVMLRPGTGTLQWIALLPVASALASTIRDLLTRRMSAGDTSIAIEFYTQATVVVAALTTLPFGWVMPSTTDFILIVITSLFLTSGNYLMTESLRFGEATAVTPFRYTMLVWTAAVGLFLFGEVPDAWAIVGSLLIVVSGLYIVARETRRRRARVKTPPNGT